MSMDPTYMKPTQQLNFLDGVAQETPEGVTASTRPTLSTNEQITTHTPWAHAMRPDNWENFRGQPHLHAWRSSVSPPPGLIFWGPSGCGKTTLAFILAKQWSIELSVFNAVLSGIPELRKTIAQIQDLKKIYPAKTFAIFIDEIHRFNRGQQDALLPYVETGEFILFGATTENPRVSINRALLSRLQILELAQLDHRELEKILKQVCIEKQIAVDDELVEFLADTASGDARRAIGNLQELMARPDLNREQQKAFVLTQARHYDKSGDRHYDVISAFIKSMRASDPNAAVLYLAIMLDGGEDPVFIARRLVIFASEDVGNAVPSALTLAVNALVAVQNIGMPEARIILSQATLFLASAPKSNASYLAINEAIDYVRTNESIEIPEHFKNQHNSTLASASEPYQYPHDLPGQITPQTTTTLNPCPEFYRPKNIGQEEQIRQNLSKNKQLRDKLTPN